MAHSSGLAIGDKVIAPIMTFEKEVPARYYGCNSQDLLGYVDENGVLDNRVGPLYDLVFTGVKRFKYSDQYRSTFNNIYNMRSVSFPDLIDIINLTNVISFNYKPTLKTISFPVLKKIYGPRCLETLAGGCQNLTSITFPVLEVISLGSLQNGGCLYNFIAGTNVKNLSFPKLKTIHDPSARKMSLNGMLNDTKPDIVVHFPALLREDVIQQEDYATRFGNPDATILFDL